MLKTGNGSCVRCCPYTVHFALQLIFKSRGRGGYTQNAAWAYPVPASNLQKAGE